MIIRAMMERMVFGGSGHDNEDVSNCDDGSDNDSGHGQEMLGLKTPVYTSLMAKFR